jgi:uncharacterized protein YsxB (DUF464 family)
LIALTGQVSTHAPQSMQVSAAIPLLSPASAMAFTGQESSHAPQLMHSSEIVCANVIHLLHGSILGMKFSEKLAHPKKKVHHKAAAFSVPHAEKNLELSATLLYYKKRFYLRLVLPGVNSPVFI